MPCRYRTVIPSIEQIISNTRAINKMIVVGNPILDFIIHTIILMLIGLYIRTLGEKTTMPLITISVIGAAIITYLNHQFMYQLRMSNIIS